MSESPRAGFRHHRRRIVNVVMLGLTGVAALVTLDANGACSDLRIGVTGAAAVPWRATNVEERLRGGVLGDEAILAAADLVDEGIEPLDDLHGSAEYRRRVTRGLTRRAIAEAVRRAATA